MAGVRGGLIALAAAACADIRDSELRIRNPAGNQCPALHGTLGAGLGHRSFLFFRLVYRRFESPAGRGAQIAILGCTELPLLLAQSDNFPVAGKSVVLLDPTEILARKCVSLSE